MNPTVMFVRLSENCNAGCFMCYFAHQHGLYNITDEQFDSLIQYMNDKGTYNLIRFTGGEPLLHKNIINYIKKSHDAGYQTSIITNGYLLPNYGQKLVDAGLDQVIISIDGSKPEIHDKLRGLKGGLERVKKGIEIMREQNPYIMLRANTVVSPYNIADMVDLHNMLEELHFNSWSIIPIRPTDSPDTLWDPKDIEFYKEKYNEFLKNIDKHNSVELLGYSKAWAGETNDEISKTFNNQFRINPTNKCNLVDYVRFYIPDKDLVVPCNCAAHRINQIEADCSSESDKYKKADIMAEWLKENGKSHCTGCEPLNAYVADNPKILTKKDFKY